jgi:hypothetical protein
MTTVCDSFRMSAGQCVLARTLAPNGGVSETVSGKANLRLQYALCSPEEVESIRADGRECVLARPYADATGSADFGLQYALCSAEEVEGIRADGRECVLSRPCADAAGSADACMQWPRSPDTWRPGVNDSWNLFQVSTWLRWLASLVSNLSTNFLRQTNVC